MTTEQHARRILLVDDEENIGVALRAFLAAKGYGDWVVDQAPTMEMGLERAKGAFVTLLDMTIPPKWTPETSKHLIPKFRKECPVIVITGWGDQSALIMGKAVSELISEWGAEQVFIKGVGFEWGNVLMSAMAAQGRRQYDAKVATADHTIGTHIRPA